MPTEQTLSLIKPDGVARGLVGEVMGRFEKAGLKIRAMKMVHLSREQAQAFYAVHKERPFYDSLTGFMSSGPIVAMILAGEDAIQKNRDLMGATDYRQAAPGTIRADFARDIEANIVHGSDGPDTARTEIAFFFNALEVV
jgi:nucleoside-diphosphate kinase